MVVVGVVVVIVVVFVVSIVVVVIIVIAVIVVVVAIAASAAAATTTTSCGRLDYVVAPKRSPTSTFRPKYRLACALLATALLRYRKYLLWLPWRRSALLLGWARRLATVRRRRRHPIRASRCTPLGLGTRRALLLLGLGSSSLGLRRSRRGGLSFSQQAHFFRHGKD